MGWINQGKVRNGVTADAKGKELQKAAVGAASIPNLAYEFCDQKTPEAKLPFIPADVVRNRSGKVGDERLWIVVNKVIYDCTDWAREHPGGPEVVESFGGRDCSWQFWRFHNREQMQRFGLPLRIGRTEGVSNPYEEPQRYSRLRAFDEEDW